MKLVAIITLTASPAFAAITFHSSCGGHDVTGTQIATVSTSTNGVGTCVVSTNDSIVVSCRQGTSNTSPTSVTDTIGNTYTHQTAADSSLDATDLNSIWTAISNSANANTVATCNFNGNQAFVSAIEMVNSGTATSSLVDTGASTSQLGSGSPATSPTFSTAQAAKVILFCGSTNNTTQGYSVGTIGGVTATNLTGDAADGSRMSACEELIVSSTQSSITATMTYSNNSNWEFGTLALKAPAAGAAGGVLMNNVTTSNTVVR